MVKSKLTLLHGDLLSYTFVDISYVSIFKNVQKSKQYIIESITKYHRNLKYKLLAQ